MILTYVLFLSRGQKMDMRLCGIWQPAARHGNQKSRRSSRRLAIDAGVHGAVIGPGTKAAPGGNAGNIGAGAGSMLTGAAPAGVGGYIDMYVIGRY